MPVEERLLRVHEGVSSEDKLLEMADDAVPLTNGERSRRIRRFMERQEQSAEARLARAEMRERAVLDAECTFKPSVNPVSEALTSGMYIARRRVGGALGLVRKRQEWLRARGPPECTFRPELNSKSRELIAIKGNEDDREIHERLYEDASRIRNEREKTEKEQEQQPPGATREHPSNSYGHVKSHYNFAEPSRLMSDITREQQRRRHRVEELRRRQESDELKECTFTPRRAADTGEPSIRRNDNMQSTSTMSSCSAIPPGPILISGYDRFMANRRMAVEARSRDRQKREASTMRTQSQPTEWLPTLTVPQPFQFSATSRSRRVVPNDEYSFQPATNESRRRAALRTALGEEEFSRFMAELDYDDSVADSHYCDVAYCGCEQRIQFTCPIEAPLLPECSHWAATQSEDATLEFGIDTLALAYNKCCNGGLSEYGHLLGGGAITCMPACKKMGSTRVPVCCILARGGGLRVTLCSLLELLRYALALILKPLSSVAVLLCHAFGVYTEDTLESRVAFLTITAIDIMQQEDF
ncbi:hypothetical protein Pmar_PMAR013112 [Perkinsus marinus ATCC 50983]|uniref:Uncharacterized protein n=1 Tax=Perkinsus marinus (strain ATCC 50983 / TXsc) TaxID=423536 RepID=C5L4Y2_PERM5|nr:hypothetical protein Pmar_PMAR013112 [Perkinsus marinus ATCC 50983]EER08202.1 hypothetical protein Pmar_PMAR013112 [Perkinsus marinus ATCC 50983]|eukprot:XP_002776386.1 hypothetical protein Pmar_PMAR013112 [Perkinsus marinus ATCC 50983]